jgi:hypothetical protein
MVHRMISFLRAACLCGIGWSMRELSAATMKLEEPL